MITPDQVARVRGRLLELVEEDSRNVERLTARLDALAEESGVGAFGALLLLLTQLTFDEDEARAHWEAIVEHRTDMAERLGREVGIRVAMLDYFVHRNRGLVQPVLIDVDLLRSVDLASGTDPETGLRNADGLREALDAELKRAARFENPVSLVLFDLDDFAGVARAGDRLVASRVLEELAARLSRGSREVDIAARPGDDELALVLPETDRNGAILVAERFRDSVSRYFTHRPVAGRTLAGTVSAGVASYPEDGSTAEILLERASLALYAAKAGGKNAVHAFQPERRRYLRFDLAPGKFEVEILGASGRRGGEARDLSRNGILFTSPEAIDVGERIELRLQEPREDGPGAASDGPLHVRGSVVRLERLAPGEASDDPDDPRFRDGYEIGVAFELGDDSGDDLLRFLEWALAERGSGATGAAP